MGSTYVEPYARPRYPTIHPQPSAVFCLRNLRWSEWGIYGAGCAAIAGGHWLRSWPRHMYPIVRDLGFWTIMGVCVGTKVVYGRMVGRLENAQEIEKYGYHPVQDKYEDVHHIRPGDAVLY